MLLLSLISVQSSRRLQPHAFLISYARNPSYHQMQGYNCIFDHYGNKPPSLSALWMGGSGVGRGSLLTTLSFYAGLSFISIVLWFLISNFLFDCLVLNLTTGYCGLELFSVEWKCLSARMLFKFNTLLSTGALNKPEMWTVCLLRAVWIAAWFLNGESHRLAKGYLPLCLKL